LAEDWLIFNFDQLIRKCLPLPKRPLWRFDNQGE
jgi:hypothetical protein